MAKWGFNSVRLPIHFDQLTLPADMEPKPDKTHGTRRVQAHRSPARMEQGEPHLS
jgi:aryl-phospho-beta-D-glucosidase BglC (GH1 family)